MRLLATLSLLALNLACYPAFHKTTIPDVFPDPSVTPEVRNALNAYSQQCAEKLDAARLDAYKAHKAQYYAGLFGSSATTLTGSGAGALGAANEKGWSGFAGGVTLVSGLVTLWLVNKPAIENAEADQQKRYQLYNDLVAARRLYETAVVRGDANEKSAAMQKFVAAMTACGLDAPPPGFL